MTLTLDHGKGKKVDVVVDVDDTEPPKSFAEIRYHKDAKEWYAAIETEVKALEAQGTWKVIDDTDIKQKPILSMFVFNTKLNPDGSLRKCKARLVAHGNKQTTGVDLDETYAPTVMYTAVWICIALAALFG